MLHAVRSRLESVSTKQYIPNKKQILALKKRTLLPKRGIAIKEKLMLRTNWSLLRKKQELAVLRKHNALQFSE